MAYMCFPLHFRHVILISFLSSGHCMGKAYRGRLGLYLWGAGIRFGRKHNNLLPTVRARNTSWWAWFLLSV